MSSDLTISQWLCGVQQGDSRALQAVWEAYFPKLVHLARQRLRQRNRRVADEEDVALSVMESFFRAAQAGRFPDLTDRHDLWCLLLRMTARKAVDYDRRENRAKRGNGQVRGESAFGNEELGAIQAVVGDAPTPEMAALMTEEFTRLLTLLNDDELERIALSKLEGYHNREIAQQLDCGERTIERRLEIIRAKWSRAERE